MFKTYYAVLLVLSLNYISSCYGDRIKDKMYVNIKSSTGCYRRMNGTHQIGCTSKRGGSSGVVHFCTSKADLQFILENGTADPYTPIVPDTLLNGETVELLRRNEEKVAGLVVYKSNESEHFTHDRQCPGEMYGVPNTCSSNKVWNPYGTGLLFQDIPFPLFYVEEEDEVAQIKDCFNKFNNFTFETQKDRPLCSLQQNAFMFAATSTPVCRRRSNKQTNINQVKFCDPLGGHNIWSSLFPVVSGPRNNSRPNNSSYIIVATRMDTTSMFEKTAGAHSPVTGMVTLLSTAKYLKTIFGNNSLTDVNVLFILFNGEAYDYIGSQRMLFDMQNGNFPVKTRDGRSTLLPVIKPEQISLFVEIGQIKHTETVYMHYLKSHSKTESLINSLKSSSTLKYIPVPDSLPPGSVHTFLKRNPELPHLLVSDHESAFVNPFYNSLYDDPQNIDYEYYNTTKTSNKIPDDSVQTHISRVATDLGRSIYVSLMGKSYTGTEVMDQVLVDELFHCYLDNPNCLVHEAINITKLQKTPYSLYVSIENNSNILTPLIALTLGWLTGEHEGPGNVNCTNKPRNYGYKYLNMSKSIYELNTTWCYKITFNQTEAVSPAFIIEDYNWTSGEYSTWSESTWEDINMRMFLKPSPVHEKLTITIGSLSMIISFFIVYFFKARSHLLFMPVVPNESPTDC